ncbi:GNAT family N-acetyltransferase [Hyphobacterium sp.]|uniref:GNAT family N-acetyltransferase n=1 Tax=Hyphobacterium sp. TaxID=2004662 RepID=UPI00374A6F03
MANSIEAELKKPSDLLTVEREAWVAFTDADPALASPYFRLEFAECCEEARSDTRVLVVRENGQIVGFLPLQMGKVGYARPLAGPLSDVHGVISEPGREVDLKSWLKAGGVPLFEFHSALGLQSCWKEHSAVQDGSWIIDMSKGFDAFEQSRAELEPKAFRNIRSRRRKLEEAEGGFEFRMDDDRPEAFATMVDWKSQQYRRTGVFDVFSVEWTGKLLKALLKKRTDRFRGICSTLNMGGQIAAVHVGMGSESRSHYWFPAYDPAFNKLSPGLLLLLEKVRVAASEGRDTVELGPGDYDFKRNLSSSQVPLAQGCILTASAPATLRGAARSLADAFEKAPLGNVGGLPRRALRKADKLASFYAW